MHGIPGSRKLQDGDIVGLDLGCIVDGFYGDAARTVAVGTVSDGGAPADAGDPGVALRGDRRCAGPASGWATSATRWRATPKHGYSVVREFVGHGIGTKLHEEPQVPNYGPPGRRERLVPGMCLAIEPMVNVGGPEVDVLKDGWTAVTKDKSLSAHFELSVAVTQLGPWILSEPYPYADQQAEARHA